MNVKKKIFNAVLCTTIGALGFALSSCNNSREIPTEAKEKTHEVTTEAYFLQEDGTLIPFSSEDLRAVTKDVETEKGKITGAGTYFHNEQATITATAKGEYKLYSLYEKNGLKNFTENAGKPASGQNTKTISTPVDQDLNFVAVFMGVNGSERGYADLKIDGQASDYTYAPVSGTTTTLPSVTTVGTELSPLKTAEGKIGGWSPTNSNYTNWTVQPYDARWVTAKVEGGKLVVTTESFVSKNSPARTITIKVGKNGTGEGASSTWRNVTITQNSYYDNTLGDDKGATPDKIVDERGLQVTLPANGNHEFNANGGSFDIKTLGYGKTYTALYKTYVNGQEQPESQWKRVTITPQFGAVANWIRVDGTKMMYAAGKNVEQTAERTSTLTVTWKAGATTVHTSNVVFKQKAITHTVGGEVN